MNRIFSKFMTFHIGFTLFFLCLPYQATALKVITTTPEAAVLVKFIGGDIVHVESLLKGSEDPHYVDALPSFIHQVRRSDAVCFIGLELEDGWLPKVLRSSGNAQIQRGGQGYCNLGKGVDVLDKPSTPVDRSMGDIHPSGNPHFNLSPKHLAQASSVILETLIRLKPSSEKEFTTRHKKLTYRLNALTKKLRKLVEPYTNDWIFMEYHKEFTYLLHTLSLKSLGALEEKPGVPPSARRISQIAHSAKNRKVTLILANPTAPERLLSRFKTLSGGIPVLRLPVMAQLESFDLTLLEEFFEYLVQRMISAHKTKREVHAEY